MAFADAKLSYSCKAPLGENILGIGSFTVSAMVPGRKRQLANQAVEAPSAPVTTAANGPDSAGAAPAGAQPAPGSSAAPADASLQQAEPPQRSVPDLNEPAPSENAEHAQLASGPLAAELDATAEMETDAAPVTDGVDEVPVTADAEKAAAAPVAVLTDETAAVGPGDAAVTQGDEAAAVLDTGAASVQLEAAGGSATEALPEGGGSVAAPAQAGKTGNDAVWGPVIKAQSNAGGGGKGKWSGVDPVNFITDEAMLSSLVQFYGFGGPSEDVIRTHLARLLPYHAPCSIIVLIVVRQRQPLRFKPAAVPKSLSQRQPMQFLFVAVPYCVAGKRNI